VCGHEHFVFGHTKIEKTHVFRSSVVNFPEYEYVNKPIHVEWNKTENEIEIMK
jgi:hypothetical protein